MTVKRNVLYIHLIFCLCLTSAYPVGAHDIIFCGERIPVSNNFVATKLMNVIRRQIPEVNLPQLRKRVVMNFPRVEYYLRQTGLPEDFKYLAIVESGFLNVTSPVGARGFWQLMPETARDMGLLVNGTVD
ncbi:MAG TPA: transglycosylase SLT domain-containing protein, partial [Segetibacter sp.]